MADRGLLIFTRTVGEPYFEECLRRIEDSTPEPHRLLVWVNGAGAGAEHVATARKYTNDVVVSDRNKGVVGPIGYAMLYEPYDELVQLGCAIMTVPGWIAALRRPFREHPGVGVTGMRSQFGNYKAPAGATEECDLTNLPDHLLMSTREVVERVGAFSPSFEMYGHEVTELMARAWCTGLRHFAVETGCYRYDGRHDGRDALPDRERYVQKNLGVWKRCAERRYAGYSWWRSDL